MGGGQTTTLLHANQSMRACFYDSFFFSPNFIVLDR